MPSSRPPLTLLFARNSNSSQTTTHSLRSRSRSGFGRFYRHRLASNSFCEGRTLLDRLDGSCEHAFFDLARLASSSSRVELTFVYHRPFFPSRRCVSLRHTSELVGEHTLKYSLSFVSGHEWDHRHSHDPRDGRERRVSRSTHR